MSHPRWMRRLSKPSRVASILDWNKTARTVLAVNFHKNRVGIAIASHPSKGLPCLELEPLRFGDRIDTGESDNGSTSGNRHRNSIAGAIDRNCLERFSKIVEEHKVCGVVVHWPLQRDTGRMGAACGRVVFALEQLWARSDESSPDRVPRTGTARDATDRSGGSGTSVQQPHETGLLSRPFCLWDARRIDRAHPSKKVDAFGRCPSYGKGEESSMPTSASSKARKRPSFERSKGSVVSDGHSHHDAAAKSARSTAASNDSDRFFRSEQTNCYFAGREQYYEDEQTVVSGVWEDFSKEHWPDLGPSARAAAASEIPAATTTASTKWNDTTPRTRSPFVVVDDDGSSRLPRAIADTIRTTKQKKRSLVTMR